MKVREIMTTDVESARPDSTLKEIAGLMREEDVGAIPVVDEDELIGIITDRDIVIRCIADGKNADEITAEEVISETLHTIQPDENIQNASRLMAEHQVRRLPVVENGRLVGMLSIGDIAVKHAEGDSAGQTLEQVSRGVKQEGHAPKGAARSEDFDRANAMDRGGRRGVQGGGRAKDRKQRVVSIRSQRSKRGAQGRKTSRRKAG